LPHARLADFYTVKVVYFCSGEWCVFIPALTRSRRKNQSLITSALPPKS
jgi:hypothetical protein